MRLRRGQNDDAVVPDADTSEATGNGADTVDAWVAEAIAPAAEAEVVEPPEAEVVAPPEAEVVAPPEADEAEDDDEAPAASDEAAESGSEDDEDPEAAPDESDESDGEVADEDDDAPAAETEDEADGDGVAADTTGAEAVEPALTLDTVFPESESGSEPEAEPEPAASGRGARRAQKKAAAAAVAAAAPAPVPENFKAPKLERSGPPIGELLLEKGKLTKEELEEALFAQKESGEMLGAILMSRGAVNERELIEALASQYRLPVVDLRTTMPDAEALATLDARHARELRALPMRVNDHGVAIAVDSIPDTETIQRLFVLTGKDIALVLAPPGDLRRGIESSYRAIADVHQFVEAFETDTRTRQPEPPPVVEVRENAPVVQVVNRLITDAVRSRASDIHIEPMDDKVRVRFRVDGALHEPLHLPSSMAQPLVSRLKIMAEMNIVERRRAQDGQFEFETEGETLDVRVATMSTIWGEKIVLRILDRGKSLRELPELGMPADTARIFSQVIRSPFGMVVCAGPTGSGKTTTLYAALNEINDPERNITTIEDPVEYIFPDANQIQINETAGVTFAGGLRAILRQDPDVILVGEVRDVETARIAVQSALTGHLVLSSIHATDSTLALQRFLDMGIESFLVASSVVGIVAQRLVRRICTHCVEGYEPHNDELGFYEAAGGKEKTYFLHGAGCNFCSHTGYAERIGVFELMRVSNELAELVLQQAPHTRIHELAVEQGMRTLRDEGISLVEQDVTTIGEVMRRVYAA